jgi:uncharacterized membrane protein HdeD (DUF308 family)
MILTILGILFLVIGCFLIFIGIKIKRNSSASSGPILVGSVTPEIRSLYSDNYSSHSTGKGPIIAGIIFIIVGIIFLGI